LRFLYSRRHSGNPVANPTIFEITAFQSWVKYFCFQN
jgi:hypothetical protein